MGIRVIQGGGVGHPRVGVTADSSAFYTQSPLNLTPSRESRLLKLSPKTFKNISSPGKRLSPQMRPPVLPEESSAPSDESIHDSCSNKPDLKAIINPPIPHASVNKPFLLSDGKVTLEASLDKAVYSHGEQVKVNVAVNNSSHKTVRRIKVFVVQHVDVCMFSNGKFKNVVAMATSKDECPVTSGGTMNSSYVLHPTRGVTKNWIALEDSYSKNGASLASTVICNSNSQEDRNVFAIYVSYYVKVKLNISAMGGDLSVKLPFVLAHTCREEDMMSPDTNEGLGDVILKNSNGQRFESSNKEVSGANGEDIHMENIPPGENVESGKIVVNVEDHTTGKGILSGQVVRRKSDTKTTKMHTEDDMNLITTYESDST